MSFLKIFLLTFSLACTQLALAIDLGRVGIFYFDEHNDFIAEIAKYFKRYNNSMELQAESFDAERDPEKQIEQLKSFVIGNEPKVIIVNPVDELVTQTAIDLAREIKASVIFFNRRPDDALLQSYPDAWYVGANPRQAGIYQAGLLGAYLKEHRGWDQNRNRKIDIIILKGEPEHLDTIKRTQAFRQGMRLTKFKLNVVYEKTCNWSDVEAENFITSIAGKLHEVEAIVSNNDAMALGALRALQAHGYNDPSYPDRAIPLIGVDGIRPAINAILKGEMLGTVAQPAKEYARVLAMLAQQLRENKFDEAALGIPFNDQIGLVPYEEVKNRRPHKGQQ